ncbi:unnamed protein product [Diatraea saccharalis]|uniref:Uncharacterized protein n=1 Tax=Diatraea saccharalis TaxID=40085 RepID=A0A9N9REV0_9NEOP|nr:unnamed protein product [Diatraea saccharalis]
MCTALQILQSLAVEQYTRCSLNLTMVIRVVLFLAMLGCIQCKILNLSCQQIRSFVDGHNNRRQQLANGKVPGQPAASVMKYMVRSSVISFSFCYKLYM